MLMVYVGVKGTSWKCIVTTVTYLISLMIVWIRDSSFFVLFQFENVAKPIKGAPDWRGIVSLLPFEKYSEYCDCEEFKQFYAFVRYPRNENNQKI